MPKYTVAASSWDEFLRRIGRRTPPERVVAVVPVLTPPWKPTLYEVLTEAEYDIRTEDRIGLESDDRTWGDAS